MSGILKFLLSRMPVCGIVSSGEDNDDPTDSDDPDTKLDGTDVTDPPESDVTGETELVVAIGAEPAPGSDDIADIEAPLEDGTPPSPLIKQLRQKAKDDATKLREVEAERDAAVARAAPKVAEPEAIVVGEKPTLEGCDYDSDKLAAELEAWIKRGHDAAKQTEDRKTKQTAAEQAYQVQVDAYKDSARALKVKDFDASEKAVEAALPGWQQSAILKHAKNSALFVYAIGRDAPRLKELGAITDPVEFGKKLTTTESEIKTVNKPKFAPEDKPLGHGGGSPAGKSELAVAQAKYEKTGDATEVIRIKKAIKAAGQKA